MALEGPYITTNTRLDTGGRTGMHAPIHKYVQVRTCTRVHVNMQIKTKHKVITKSKYPFLKRPLLMRVILNMFLTDWLCNHYYFSNIYFQFSPFFPLTYIDSTKESINKLSFTKKIGRFVVSKFVKLSD